GILEPSDVLAHLIRELAFIRALLDVRTVEPLHVTAIEYRRPRANGFELWTNLFEQRRFEDAGSLRRLVRVVFEDVPAAEHDIVERRERHEILDRRRSSFRALAETHGAHLREGTDRLRQPAPHCQHTSDRGRADRTHPDEHNTQFPCSFRDFWRIFH